MKALIDQGPYFLTELFWMAMNEAMRLEREAFLNAGAYERTEGRLGYANGFKPKTVNMRSGSVALSIPQTRDCDFYPRSLTKGLRSKRALTLAMAEMYVQGVSTRKVKNILEKCAGSKSVPRRCRMRRRHSTRRYGCSGRGPLDAIRFST